MRLFKYLHPDRVDVLRHRMLCFSSPLNLNDPFELRPAIKLYDSEESIRAAAEEFLTDSIQVELTRLPPQVRALITEKQVAEMRTIISKTIPRVVELHTPAIQTSFNDAVAKHIGMLCLSERQDDLLMWAHYANSHEGFVVEFDPTSAFFHGRRSDKDELRFLRKVAYTNVRPQLIMSSAEDMSAFLKKSSHWAYEREWRMMFALADATEVKVFGEKQFHLFAYPASAVKSVTLGCRMSAIKREELLEVLSSDPELSAVAIYEASPDDLLFRLNISHFERE